MYLLDTDHFSFIQRPLSIEYEQLMRRMARHSPTEIFVSIVSFHEQMLGCHSRLQAAKKAADVVRAFQLMNDVLSTFSDSQVLLFNETASHEYARLKGLRTRVATADLRIAAVALSHGMVLLTRNVVDFGRVPGLMIEDWTTDYSGNGSH